MRDLAQDAAALLSGVLWLAPVYAAAHAVLWWFWWRFD